MGTSGKRKMILLVLLIAFLLRLVSLNQSYWLDEAIGLIAVKQNSLWQLLSEFPKFDNHPPFFYLVLKVWTDIFGYGEISTRLMPVLMGVLTVYVVYKLGELINKKEGVYNRWPIVSAIFLATSPLHIYYSQEVRMYPLTTLLASTSIYFFIKVLTKHSIVNWLFFSLSILLLITSDYIPIFLLPIFLIISIVFKKNFDWYKKLFFSFLPLGILIILWIQIFLVQIERGKWLLSELPTWEAVAGGANLKQIGLVWVKFILGRISFVDKTLYGIVVLFSSIPALYLLKKAWTGKVNLSIILWLWLLIPLLLGLLISLFIPAFVYFRFLYILPAFYMLLALGLSKIDKLKIPLIVSIILINISCWTVYVTNPEFQRENWREAVKLVESNTRENEITLFEFPDPPAPFIWYGSKIISKGAFSSLYAVEDDVRVRVEELTLGVDGIWYFNYLRDLSDPKHLVEKNLSKHKFKVTSEYSFPGVGKVSYYQRYE